MNTANISETREARFKRIAAKRTQRILNDLRLLGNCSNKGVYKYGDEEILKIFRAIEGELRRVRSLFSRKNSENQFSL